MAASAHDHERPTHRAVRRGPPSPALAELAQAYGVSTGVLGLARPARASSRRDDPRGAGGLRHRRHRRTNAVEAALAANRDRAWRRVLPPVVVHRRGPARRSTCTSHDGDPVEVWVELEDGGRRRPAPGSTRWVPPRDGRRRAGRRGDVRAARRPAAGLAPAARRRRRGRTSTRRWSSPPRRLALPAAARATAAWGLADPALQRALEPVLGHRRPGRPGRAGGLGGARARRRLRAGQPAARGRAGRRRWSPRRTCRRPAASSTRSTCGSRTCPSSPTLRSGRAASSLELARRRRAPRRRQRPDRPRRRVDGQARRAARSLYAAAARRRRAQRGLRRLPAPRGRRAGRLRDLVRAGRGARDRTGTTGRRSCATRARPRSRRFARRLRRAGRLPRWLQWLLDEQLADAQAERARRRDGAGRHARPRRRRAPGRRRRVGARRTSLAPRRHRRRAAGRRTTRSGRTGASRRGGRTGWPSSATRRSATWSRTVLRHAGGVRVDHVIGLFRLWWMPAGQAADRGHLRPLRPRGAGRHPRPGGRSGPARSSSARTSAPSSRGCATTCADRGLLGTSILWFESDDGSGGPLPPERWRECCLASVTTHDLPPTAGYLAGEHVRLRQELGLLTRPLERGARGRAGPQRGLARRAAAARPARARRGHRRATIEALHRLIAWTPARLIGVALTDAVGELRTINQPGTDKEYPNWQLGLADEKGEPVLLEDVIRSRRARDLARAAATG